LKRVSTAQRIQATARLSRSFCVKGDGIQQVCDKTCGTAGQYCPLDSLASDKYSVLVNDGALLLERWLARSGYTQTRAARESGVDEGMLSHYLGRERRPGLRNALALERLTAGAVPARAWTNGGTKAKRK
jgi:predicted AlkP superfamily phosphohydrolase/phosphomutase